ncbi:MAG: TolC family protein [Myxococcota bacterium]|nr:TolC family protein [Myxococcota bacterium]
MTLKKIAAMMLAMSVLGTGGVAEEIATKKTATRVPANVIRLTLAACVDRAMTNSGTLAAQRHRLAMLDAQVKQVFWAPFSGISMSAFGSFVPDLEVDKERLENEGVLLGPDGGPVGADDDYLNRSWGPTLRFELKAGIPVYTFGKISNAKEAATQARAAKQAEYYRFEHQIRYQVAQAYHAIAGAREMLYTISKGKQHLKQARDKVEKDLQNQEGTSTEIDLIKLKVFEGEVVQYETQSLEIERVGLAALRFLVGGADGPRVDIVDTPQTRVAETLESIETYKDTALRHRPELKALRHAVKALEAKVALRRSDFWPDLLVVGGIRRAWTPGRTRLDTWGLYDNYNFGTAYAVGIAINYKFDLGLDVYRLEEAKAELAALTTDQKAALEGVMLEVERTYHRAAASRDALLAQEKSKRLVKGWVAAVLQNQATGLSSAKDVKDALTEYFKVMAQIHKLTHDYNVSIAQMHRVTGE